MPAPKPRKQSFEERYPNLAAERAMDRERHIKQAMEAGMSRKQAEKHADEELAERDD